MLIFEVAYKICCQRPGIAGGGGEFYIRQKGCLAF